MFATLNTSSSPITLRPLIIDIDRNQRAANSTHPATENLFQAGVWRVLNKLGLAPALTEQQAVSWMKSYTRYQMAADQLARHSEDKNATAHQQDLLRAHFNMALMEAEYTGKLGAGDNAWLKGLEIVQSAQRNASDVTTGTLCWYYTGTDKTLPQKITLPHSLVMEQQSDRNSNGEVVLYNSLHAWNYFPEQASFQQFPDMRRLGQAVLSTSINGTFNPEESMLREQILLAAAPLQRPALERYFNRISLNPSLKHCQLRAEPLPGSDFQEKLNQFIHTAVRSVIANSPSATLLGERQKLAQQQFSALMKSDVTEFDTYLRQQVSADFSRALNQSDIRFNATLLDPDGIEIAINGLRGSLSEWADNLYRFRPDDNPLHSDNTFVSSRHLPGRIIHLGAEGARSLYQFFSTTNNERLPGEVRITQIPQGLILNQTTSSALDNMNRDVGLQRRILSQLRGGYVIDRYGSYLRSEHIQKSSASRKAWITLQKLNIERAAESAREGGVISAADEERIIALMERMAGGGKGTRYPNDRLSDCRLRYAPGGMVYPLDITLPEVYTVQLASSAPDERAFVYFPPGIYGQRLLPASTFLTYVVEDGANVRPLLRNLTAPGDLTQLDNVLKMASGSHFTLDAVALSGLEEGATRYFEQLIARAEANRYTRKHFINELLMKMAGYGAAVACIGTGGTFKLACGSLMLPFIAQGGRDIVRQLEQGETDSALLKTWLLLPDAADGLPALGMLLKATGRSVKKLSGLLGRKLSTPQQVADAVEEVVGWRKAIDAEGRLRSEVAASETVLDASSRYQPRQDLPGEFWQSADKVYIRDQGKAFEVYSDNGWRSVRLRDPAKPHAAGPKIIFRDNRWQLDTGGLNGGGVGQSRQNSFLIGIAEDQHALQNFLSAFDFGGGARGHVVLRGLIEQLRQGRLPARYHASVIPGQEWRALGMIGISPPTRVPAYSATFIRAASQGFVFADNRQGKALLGWLLRDRCGTSTEVPLPAPDWAMQYATREHICTLYPGKTAKILTARGITHSEAEGEAYAAVITSSATRHPEANLLQLRLRGASVNQYARASSELAIMDLAGRGGMMSREQVDAWLHKFHFPAKDKIVMEAALLSSLAAAGNPPDWAKHHLTCWKKVTESLSAGLTDRSARIVLKDVLLQQGIVRTVGESIDFMAGLSRIPGNQLEKMMADTLLDIHRQLPEWSAKYMPPDALYLFFGNRIPASMKTVHINLSSMPVGSSFHLPANMPELERLHIEVMMPVSGRDYWVDLPENMPLLKDLKLTRISLTEPTVALNNQPKLTSIFIRDVHHLEQLRLEGDMSALYRIEVGFSPQLRQVELATEFPTLHTLSLCRSQQLQRVSTSHPLNALLCLYLDGNALTSLADFNQQAMPRLTVASLISNQLRSLEGLPPELPQLDQIRLNNNRFRSVTDAIWQLRPQAQVYLDNNPLSLRVIDEARQVALAPGYRGPVIFFSMAETSTRLARPLQNAVADWFPQPLAAARMQTWSGFAEQESAREFSQFLDRLRLTVNYDSEMFRTNVRSWLDELEQNAALRQESFTASHCATDSCEDRVSLAYNEMKKLRTTAEVNSGRYDRDPKGFSDKLRGIYRLELLDGIAREHVSRLRAVDPIEVYLAYQVKLRTQLKLPIDTEDMRFFAVSHVTQADINKALQSVLTEEAKGFTAWLAGNPAMQNLLQRRYPDAFRQAQEAVEDVVADPDVYTARINALLRKDHLENDADAMREAGIQLMKQLNLEHFGPLVRQFLN
ncbi:NEL-type E3 ubiquitin ligase domain-containing protein [Pantoea sp. A4]|uniref:NEL-type E3 ubiquitin ligase domain-containing protein n=1 Tax=Pantoea sp. A4 TaxID=1225184 RepID=UPI0003625B61|nr:NEL-type E3 ubiquitin ligase domain-containing protein [Pantoea sp. A4]